MLAVGLILQHPLTPSFTKRAAPVERTLVAKLDKTFTEMQFLDCEVGDSRLEAECGIPWCVPVQMRNTIRRNLTIASLLTLRLTPPTPARKQTDEYDVLNFSTCSGMHRQYAFFRSRAC